MDRGGEYAQSDQSSAATYSTQQDPRSATLSSNTTPQSDYGLSSSARAPAYSQEHLTRYPQYTQSPHQQGPIVTMAQQPSPSQSLPDGASNARPNTNHSNMHSNPDVPIDPSISQQSPTYPPNPYSPYGGNPGQDGMPQYPQHGPPQYPPYDRGPQPGPWPGYPPQPPMQGHYQHPGAVGHPPPTTAAQRPGQVYSFVPIPGAQQHKRPRRRYEEIERMYKCGWNGCEKAYGTLNHLNAHVTMQSHGSKRTPEEFKEIRKEWKARKKEEENARKQEEDRARVAQAQAQAQAQQGVEGQPGEHPGQGQGYQTNGGGRPSLPPIGYQTADGPAQGQYGQQGGMVYPQNGGNMHYQQGYPNSPYGQQAYQQQNQQNHY